MKTLFSAQLVALLLVTGVGSAAAQDRVSVRGVYYREASTRVVEPMVTVSKTLPEGLDVSAHYLLDAVTSASVAAGAGVRTDGADEAFNEFRHEVGMAAGYTFEPAMLPGNPMRVGGFFRYSREPDYESAGGGLSLSQAVWDNTGVVSVNVAVSDDQITAAMLNRDFDTLFAGVSYTQALSPTLLVQAGYEFFRLDGYQANAYLNDPLGRPRVPELRLRHVLAGRVAYYIPISRTGLQAHYRFHIDGGAEGAWGLAAHTAEGRVYQALHRDVEVRLSLRVHTQDAAAFWCNALPDQGGDPRCLTMRTFDAYHSIDPKYGHLKTFIPEIKVMWDLRLFEIVPFLSFFAPGTAELSYGRFIQDSRYGNAHLLQVAYTLPF